MKCSVCRFWWLILSCFVIIAPVDLQVPICADHLKMCKNAYCSDCLATGSHQLFYETYHCSAQSQFVIHQAALESTPSIEDWVYSASY